MRHSSSQARRTTRRYAHFGTRRHVLIVLIDFQKITRSLESEHSNVQIGTNSWLLLSFVQFLSINHKTTRFYRSLGFITLWSVFFLFLTIKSENLGLRDLISKRVFFVVFFSSETELTHRQSFSSWSSAPSFSVENIGFRRVITAKKTVYPTKTKKTHTKG